MRQNMSRHEAEREYASFAARAIEDYTCRSVEDTNIKVKLLTHLNNDVALLDREIGRIRMKEEAAEAEMRGKNPANT